MCILFFCLVLLGTKMLLKKFYTRAFSKGEFVTLSVLLFYIKKMILVVVVVAAALLEKQMEEEVIREQGHRHWCCY